jgi:site-specific recombinase XerD
MSELNLLYLTVFGRKSSNGKEYRIYIKIRVSGLGDKALSAGVSVAVSNFKNGKFSGRTVAVMEAEKNTRSIKELLQESYWNLVKSNQVPTPELVVTNLLNLRKEQLSLTTLLDTLVLQKEEMARSKESSMALPEKFRVLRTNAQAFVLQLYKRNDVFLNEVNLDFVSRFAVFLKSVPNSNVTVNKKLSNLSQCFTYAVQNQWMPVNPCLSWKSLPEPSTNQEYLTESQLTRLIDFKFPNPSYEIVKDGFLFMCFTGLAYADLKAFTFEKVVLFDGEPIIQYNRTKTKKDIRIPLLPQAMSLVNKYYAKPILKNRRQLVEKGPKDLLFPIQANATFNEKIKTFFEYNEMELDFKISTHAGRKTFGNLVARLVGITDASQLLGHTSITVTEQSYVDNQSDQLLSKRAVLLRKSFEELFNNNKK